MDTKAYLAIILHAHLPYIRHPNQPGVLEERWLFEAITDCYLPLLAVIRGWEQDRIRGKITLSITPTLAAMLTDDLLKDRYEQHLHSQLHLADKEQHRLGHDHRFKHLAEMYRQRLEQAYHDYKHRYDRDLISAFRHLSELGRIDIIASCASHGFLPLLAPSPSLVSSQIRVGVDYHRNILGANPAGFWLPECGYTPGVDEQLAAAGIRWFALEHHGVLHASVRPKYGVYAPIYCPSGVAAFGRDTETSHQVWSADEGYPGDYWYREFYRDIGHELDEEYLKDHLPPGPIRTHTGFKYYRITGNDDKQPYEPERAQEQVEKHASNFAFNRHLQADYLADGMDRPPIIVAPYDAELFGHWWFEGPSWLDIVIRRLATESIEAISPTDYLCRHRVNQVCKPSMSSWGYRGYNEVWLEGSNDWVYRHLHLAGDRMAQLVGKYPDAYGTVQRALNQASRELLLATASDWPFIMKTGTVVDYAKRRVSGHISNFNRLWEQLNTGAVDERWLQELESDNNIFPDIDYRRFNIPEIASGEPSGPIALIR